MDFDPEAVGPAGGVVSPVHRRGGERPVGQRRPGTARAAGAGAPGAALQASAPPPAGGLPPGTGCCPGNAVGGAFPAAGRRSRTAGLPCPGSSRGADAFGALLRDAARCPGPAPPAALLCRHLSLRRLREDQAFQRLDPVAVGRGRTFGQRGVPLGVGREGQQGAQVTEEQLPPIADGLRPLPVGVPDDRQHLAGAHLPVPTHRLGGVPLQLVEHVPHPDVVHLEIGELKVLGLGRPVLVDAAVEQAETQVGLPLGVGHEPAVGVDDPPAGVVCPRRRSSPRAAGRWPRRSGWRAGSIARVAPR